MKIYKSDERAKTEAGWLSSRHSFNFNNHYNPERESFGKLLVLNDDVIAPGQGFSPHPHSNMEIVTFILEGELKHTDSTGSSAILKAGDVQVMSAGKQIIHSERNASDKHPLKLLQIWIHTNKKDAEPRHEEGKPKQETNKLTLIASGEKTKAPMIYQDAWLYTLTLENHSLKYERQNKSNGVFIFVINGKAEVNNQLLEERDSIEVEEDADIKSKSAKLLIIEVPM